MGLADLQNSIHRASERDGMKKAAIYARVSSERQKKEGTIASQIAELKKQVAASGDILTKEYIDDGYSGAKLDRPGLEQLRKDVKTDLFDVVYFLNTDRIAREVTYQTIIVGEILKQNKQVIINSKDYVHNPENKFTLTVLGAVAELERAKIIERYSRGRMHKIRQGQLISSGLRTFGYDYIPRGLKPAHLVINEQEAKVVRLIFKMYAEDERSKSAIIRHLEDNRIPTKTGKYVWEWKTLQDILKNHSYIGIKYFNTRTLVKKPSDPIRKVKYGKEVFKDKSEWLPVKVPSIVEPELFHKARERVARNRKRYMNPREIQLLSNLVKCGECGGSCTGYKRFVRGYKFDKQKKKLVPNGHIYHRVAYICSRRIRQELHSKNSDMKRCSNPQIYTHRLESAVQSIVEETMTNETKLKNHLIGHMDKPSTVKSEAQRKLKAIEQKLLDFTNRKREIVDLYAKGKINRAEYGKKCQQYDAAINEAKNTRTALLTMIPALHQKGTVESSVESYCNGLKSRLQNCADFDTRRQLMLNYIKQIVFARGKVEVHGSVPIQLGAYSDPDQSSEASEIRLVIERKI